MLVSVRVFMGLLEKELERRLARVWSEALFVTVSILVLFTKI